jgi:translation initiation factor IF-2
VPSPSRHVYHTSATQWRAVQPQRPASSSSSTTRPQAPPRRPAGGPPPARILAVADARPRWGVSTGLSPARFSMLATIRYDGPHGGPAGPPRSVAQPARGSKWPAWTPSPPTHQPPRPQDRLDLPLPRRLAPTTPRRPPPSRRQPVGGSASHRAGLVAQAELGRGGRAMGSAQGDVGFRRLLPSDQERPRRCRDRWAPGRCRCCPPDRSAVPAGPRTPASAGSPSAGAGRGRRPAGRPGPASGGCPRAVRCRSARGRVGKLWLIGACCPADGGGPRAAAAPGAAGFLETVGRRGTGGGVGGGGGGEGPVRSLGWDVVGGRRSRFWRRRRTSGR